MITKFSSILAAALILGFVLDRISRVHSQAGEALPQPRCDNPVLSASTGCFSKLLTSTDGPGV